LGARNPYGFNDCRSPKPCAPETFPAKNEAGRLPGPPRRRSERDDSPGSSCPEELRNEPGYCRATCSLSGENEVRPAPHFAVPAKTRGPLPKWSAIIAGFQDKAQHPGPQQAVSVS